MDAGPKAFHRVLQRTGCPTPIRTLIERIYMNTETTCNVAGGNIEYAPTRGVKEGLPSSPLFFLLVYNMLINALTAKFPDTEKNTCLRSKKHKNIKSVLQRMFF